MLRGARRSGPVVVCAALLALFAGCGGSGSTQTSGEVMRCILDAGGQAWPLAPTEPAGSPKQVETVFTIGPQRGHIGIYLSAPPVFTSRLVEAYDAIGEYKATRVQGGRILVLLDTGIAKKDRETAFECARG